MRQIILDTETTGLEPEEGHRIIEIACVELVNRRITEGRYHQYLYPDREIDEAALAVHGLTNALLQDSPRFEAIARDFLDFIRGSEVIIHNAPFDVGFINYELSLLGSKWGALQDYCEVVDSLELARALHPGKRNGLDALCGRYKIDNSQRQLHGALLDAELLATVYVMMTGGQASLQLEIKDQLGSQSRSSHVHGNRPRLVIVQPTGEELDAHRKRLLAIEEISGGRCIWTRLERNPPA